MMPDLSKYTDEQRQWLKITYVDNECDTDEYGETQPEKQLGIIADAIFLLEQAGRSCDDLMKLVKTWINAYSPERYAGAQEFRAICEVHFDLNWAAGRIPYADTIEEIDQYLEDMQYERPEER